MSSFHKPGPGNSQVALSVEAFILAGGASSRMGREKHTIDFGGVPLIVRTVELLKPLVDKVSIVGAVQPSSPDGAVQIADYDFGITVEKGRSKGPLSGIVTALRHSASSWNLILACDLPYLTPDWLSWLLLRAAKSEAQAVIPQTERGLEPLAAVYRKECAGTLERSLRSGISRVTDALKQISVQIVSNTEWAELDPHGMVLKNMNTPEDYAEACEWWRVNSAPPGQP